MTIAEFQFEIVPDPSATTGGQVFGIGADMSMDAEGFHPGSTDWATQDGQGSTGVTTFGEDKLLGPVWAWDLHVNRDDVPNAVATLGAFTTAWRAAHIRKTPGALVAVRYSLGGRIRRIFGRPGKLEASPNNLLLTGYTPVVCDFQAVDGYTYDDLETSVNIAVTESTSGATGGGFVFPLTFPYGPQAAADQSAAQVVVGGDAATHGVFTFYGPWESPGIATDDWTLSLPDYVIPAGQFVEIDTRPWKNTIMLNGIAGIGGMLGRRQSLPEALLQPGSLAVRLLGSSSTGTGYCNLRWYNAHNSL